LESLPDTDLDAERAALRTALHREATEEEFLMFLNHPGDAVKTIEFRQQYGNPNNLPLAVWFEGMEVGEELNFTDSHGKPHQLNLISVRPPGPGGVSIVRYVLDSEIMSSEVQVTRPGTSGGKTVAMADPDNAYHVGAPSTGDLWVMYVHPGDIVKKGEELFNLSIMKQEKAVVAPLDAMVRRVLKTADYRESKQMVPVREGELIVELEPVPKRCADPGCARALPSDTYVYCPYCGKKQ
jgi:pyruvate carboxylase